MRTTNHFIQSAFVVPDLQAAMRKWLATANIGPFYVMTNVRPENGLYRGRPAEVAMNIGFAQAGPMQIELVEQISPGPSHYRDSVPAGAAGFHHICHFTHDLDREFSHYRKLDVAVAYQATHGDLRFAYFDTRPQIGCMTEVMQHNEGVEGMFAMIAAAAVDWDGKDPIRPVG